MPWDLVIFDCDGMLIDSEPLAIGVEIELLGQVGIAIAFDEIAERYCGVSMKAMLGDLEARHGIALGHDFAARHAARLTGVCEAELKAVAGIEAVLDGLSGKICVASSSGPERLRRTLGLVGLYRRFEPHIFSTTMVVNGKPAPDLFLYAAARMGAEPARAVVIEDSVPGVIAVKAAGMTAIGFAGGGHCRPGHAERLREAGASAIVPAMSGLLAALTALSSSLR